MASGPSLTADDVELVRQWRFAEAPENVKRGVIVVNTTFRLAPWADGLFAMDRAWWKQHVEEVDLVFRGERFSNNGHIARFRTTYVKIISYGNSGAAAVSMAATMGAKRIVMLGYDCKYGADGRRHWHGDHPKGLGNAARVNNWLARFERLSRELPKDCRVVNASKDTALECFDRAALESVLV